MNIITIDFESYFDQDYSLSKMSTEAYVRDPRFEAHGFACCWPNQAPMWFHRNMQPVDGWLDNPIKHVLGTVPWDDTACLCHHAHFDGLILSHHYGIRPKLWLDTLSMSRLLLGAHVKHSLDGLREHFGMPVKRTPYDKFKGRHWAELDESTRQEIAEGACDEVQSIYEIFCRFMTGDY